MLIGNWGSDIVFEVSGKVARTFNELTETSSGRWTEHNPINSKPLSEFLGPGLDELEIKIILTSMLGVDPQESYDLVREKVRLGENHPLFINGVPLSGNLWAIREISGVSTEFAAGTGKVLWMELSITAREYN